MNTLKEILQDRTLHNPVGKKVTVTHDSIINAFQASMVMATFSAKDRISRREAAASLYILSYCTVIVREMRSDRGRLTRHVTSLAKAAVF